MDPGALRLFEPSIHFATRDLCRVWTEHLSSCHRFDVYAVEHPSLCFWDADSRMDADDGIQYVQYAQCVQLSSVTPSSRSEFSYGCCYVILISSAVQS